MGAVHDLNDVTPKGYYLGMNMNDVCVSFQPPKPPFDLVLVTGAAGFIGSRVVRLLSELGCRTVAVDNGYVGLPLPAASANVVPIVADIRDQAIMKQIFVDHLPDAVLHLAAVHHIPTCERNPHLAFDVNVLGTQSLLDAAEAAGTGNLVMASSGAVYVWDSGPLNEDHTATGASDVYSITKLTNEYQVRGWAERVGARAHLVRLFNTIGNGDPNGHLIPDILTQIVGGDARPAVCLGNTKPKRDYIYVDDVASGFVSALAHIMDGPAVDTFNLCTGQELSVAELVHLMGDILGKDITIQSEPSRFRKVDRLQQLGNPAKLESKTGWKAAWDARSALTAIVTGLGHLPATSRNNAGHEA
jgi:nucleoside-diphosphate-sugar epimerase